MKIFTSYHNWWLTQKGTGKGMRSGDKRGEVNNIAGGEEERKRTKWCKKSKGSQQWKVYCFEVSELKFKCPNTQSHLLSVGLGTKYLSVRHLLPQWQNWDNRCHFMYNTYVTYSISHFPLFKLYLKDIHICLFSRGVIFFSDTYNSHFFTQL